MRYLLDTNIILYYATDHSKLDKPVIDIVQDVENILCISAETVREIIVLYKNKGFSTKRWKTCEDFIASLENDFGITILPLDKNVMKTYATLTLNEHQGHKDPSDHVIIAHAITLKIPLISSDTRFPFYKKQKLDLIFNKKY